MSHRRRRELTAQDAISRLSPKERKEMLELLKADEVIEEVEFEEVAPSQAEVDAENIQKLHDKIPSKVLEEIRANNPHLQYVNNETLNMYLLHDYGIIQSVLANTLKMYTAFGTKDDAAIREIVNALIVSARSKVFEGYAEQQKPFDDQ